MSVTICLVLAVFYLRQSVPLYSSANEVLIDLQARAANDPEMPHGQASLQGSASSLVESQVAVLQSGTVLDVLINKLDLTQDPEFAGERSIFPLENAVSRLRSFVLGGANLKQSPKLDNVRRNLARQLQVKRVGDTYVVRITCISRSAEKAALIANTLAEIYIDYDRQKVRGGAQARVSPVDANLDSLRKDMQAAAEAVAQYRNGNSAIEALDFEAVERQLFVLNSELSGAQAELDRSREQIAEANRVLDDPTAADMSLLGSNLLRQLVARLTELRAQEADLQVTLLDGHPRLSVLREQRQDVETLVRKELERVVGAHEETARVAEQSVSSINEQISRLQTDAAKYERFRSQLQDLKLEADLSRKIYESFRARFERDGHDAEARTDTIRIVSVAYPASNPSYPMVGIVLSMALVVGLVAGVLFASLLNVFFGVKVEAPDKPKRSIANYRQETPVEPKAARKKEQFRRKGRRSQQ